jgi:hypothetical protein
MPIKYSIHVTKEIIRSCKNLGMVDDIDIIGDKCPVALSVRHLFPEVHISNQYIFPRGMDTQMKISLPTKVTDFINKFDTLSSSPDLRLKMKGFKFDLIIPENVIASINIEDLISQIKKQIENVI